MTAFVSSSAFTPKTLNKSLSGDAVSQHERSPSTGPRRVVVAEVYSLDKYTKMSKELPKPVESSKPSKWWTMYVNSLKERFSPFVTASNLETTQNWSPQAISAYTTTFYQMYAKINAGMKAPGGDPDTMINVGLNGSADKYMANCVRLQYKQAAVPNGVYSVRCTEGAVKQQAEESRVVALAQEYRMKHRSTVQKFGDFTEMRRKAIITAAGCSYEEKLVDRFPMSARAVFTGSSEAKGTCVRYAVGSSPVEQYMADCVDKQSKMRAVPGGVYDVLCCDGTTKNMAEYRRVTGLAARFRAGQLPKIVKEQMKFDSAKYARDYFAHGCSYEEGLFNKFPAVSASMRPDAWRY